CGLAVGPPVLEILAGRPLGVDEVLVAAGDGAQQLEALEPGSVIDGVLALGEALLELGTSGLGDGEGVDGVGLHGCSLAEEVSLVGEPGHMRAGTTRGRAMLGASISAVSRRSCSRCGRRSHLRAYDSDPNATCGVQQSARTVSFPNAASLPATGRTD